MISFWFTKGDGCVDQQDVVSGVYERYRGRVGFLSLDVRDDRGTVRDLVRERGWRMPVGFDRDGAVAGLYRVGGCPTFAYVYPGGTLQSASIGDLTAAQLGDQGRRPAARHRPRRELGAELRWTGPRHSIASPAGSRRPSRAGSPPTSPPSSPASGSPRSPSTAARARAPRRSARRLRDLSDRFYGSHAIHLRERPIPWAYRVFFRQIGLDPDRTRTPIEQLALERLHDGAFKSRGLPAGRAQRSRSSRPGSRCAPSTASRSAGSASATRPRGSRCPSRPDELAQGTLVIADERGPIGRLFGEPAEWSGIERVSRRLTIVAIQVNGVPQISVDEALWMAAATLEAA